MPASTPWRVFGTTGASSMTSIPKTQSTISGAILYKSWMGGNIYFKFTESAAVPSATAFRPGAAAAA